MNVRLRIVSAVAVALLGTVAGPAGAEENESFGIAPFPEQANGLDRATFGIPLEPGATFEDAVRIYNRTDQPIDLAVYAADARAGVDGAISVGFRGSRPEGVGAWIELSQDELSLPPRGESTVPFRIAVQSATPSPDIGAIVVENTARGLRADLAQRLSVVVRTLPPGSPTTSRQHRAFLLRSPWIVVALLGLLVAALLVWLGARRARRPQDTITPSGELAEAQRDKGEVPRSSKPILHRLGAIGRDTEKKKEQARAPRTVRTRTRHDEATEVITEAPLDTSDERPLLDLVPDEDEEPPESPPAVDEPQEPEAEAEPEASAERVTRTDAKKLNYIPLDDL